MQQGLSLIELAIVLLIVGLLAVAATPLTSGWGAGSDLHAASGQLNQAFGHARAVALRNEGGAVGDDPAARILHDAASRQLRVCRLPSGPCADPLWRSTLPSGVVLTGPFPILLNNRGQLAAPVSVQLAKGCMTDVHTFK